MARHVVSARALNGSAASLARFLSQYPRDAVFTFVNEILPGGDDGEMQFNPHYIVEFDEFAKTVKDEEIERSWRENPDRMGGSFTDEEISRYRNDSW